MSLELIGLIALGILNLTYLITSSKRGSNKANADAAVAWKGEAEALEARADRLERELSDAKTERNVLAGRVEELSNQNALLQSLVMGERVPEALDMALTDTAKQVIKRMDEVEDNLGNGILHIANAVREVLKHHGKDIDEPT